MKTGIVKRIVIFVLIIAMGLAVFGCSGSSGKSSSSKTCKSCGRSFSDSTNRNYISHTNMCKNCYLNFCWATGKTPSNYDR